MRKFFVGLLVVFLTFSNSFAYLNNQEKLLIKSAFTKYEKDISYFSANEQMRKIELITQKISDLQNTTKIKNNQVLYDVLSELDMLFQDKYSTLNSQNKYVESSVMKNLLCEQLGICEDIDKTSNYFGSNTLKVSLNSFSPNNQVAPTSGTISIGKFDFEAVGGEISINAINLRREGLGNSSDIRRIYFERNGTRVSNIAGVASDGYAYLTFSPALVINGGSSLSLDLMVEINGSNYGGEHKFSIPSADSIQAQDLKKISGSFPVVTGSLGIISYSLSEIDVYQIYGQANYSPTRYGISAGNFRISIPSGQNDYEFKSIKIRNAGDADSSLLGNIGIYKNGTEISSSISKNGREFTIKLYDLVKSGNSVNYEIRIDMVSCKGYNEYGYYEDDKYYKCEDLEKELYKFEIRNAYDIEITDYNNNLSPKVNLK